jgi:hypothetical protein
VKNENIFLTVQSGYGLKMMYNKKLNYEKTLFFNFYTPFIPVCTSINNQGVANLTTSMA